MGSWLSKEVVYFPHNLSRKGVYGKKPSSSSGSAKDSKSLAQSSLGISSPMRDKKVSSSANIMVPFSFLSYNLHNSTSHGNFQCVQAQQQLSWQVRQPHRICRISSQHRQFG